MCGSLLARTAPGRGVVLIVAAALLAGCAASGVPTVRAPGWAAAVDQPQPAPTQAATPIGASAAGNYLAGRFAQAQRDYRNAANFLARALDVDRANRELMQRVFSTYLADGQFEAAVRVARDVMGTEDGASLAAIALAVADVKAGDLAAAEARLAGIPHRGLGRFTAPLLLAWAQAGQGRAGEALATLRPLREMPGFAVLHDLHAGLINELTGDERAAEADYRSALEASTPSSFRVADALGRFLERQGRGDEARAIYDGYADDNPDSLGVAPALARLEAERPPRRLVETAAEGMAEAMYTVAGTLTQERSMQVALLYGRLALELRPDFPLARTLVAGIFEALGRPGDANRIYREIPNDSPLSWAARLRMAANLNTLGSLDEAAALLEAMADERPARADALIALGDVLRANERYEDAAAAYDRAIARIGEPDNRHWAVFYSRGIAFERSQQWPRAERDFLQALDLNPDQPYVLNYLGYSWVDQGLHLERATRMIERAVELRPNDGYIVDSLGWALYRLNDFEGAARHLERAVAIRPHDPIINDHLGDALWRVGRRTEARFQWRRALSLDPEPELVPAIEDKLLNGLPPLATDSAEPRI